LNKTHILYIDIEMLGVSRLYRELTTRASSFDLVLPPAAAAAAVERLAAVVAAR
jgi:hypothetical protein